MRKNEEYFCHTCQITNTEVGHALCDLKDALKQYDHEPSDENFQRLCDEVDFLWSVDRSTREQAEILIYWYEQWTSKI